MWTTGPPLPGSRPGYARGEMALTRSQQMARIRGKDTGPELRLRKALWAAGRRYSRPGSC